MRRHVFDIVILIGLLAWPEAGAAQAARDGRLTVTVVDPSGGILPGATVTITGLDEASKTASNPGVKTSDKGVGTLDNLVPGRYAVQAEFPGFETGRLPEIRIRSGDNRHVVVLPLKKLEDSISVTRDAQVEAGDRRGSAFSTVMTREQIDALSDDPNEMAQQLQDMAGGNATIKVDSFVGGELPPKAMIKSVHIIRDTFAAENHSAESDEIQIITQPGVGPLRGSASSRFRDGSMSGRSPFTPTKGPEFSQSYDGNVSGPLVPRRLSFSLSVRGTDAYDTPTLNASLPGGTRSEVLHLKRPTEYLSVNALVDYAVTRDQVLRLGYQQSHNSQANLGVGAYDLPERGYSAGASEHRLRFQEAGPIGRRFFASTQLQIRWRDSASHSDLEAPTTVVNGNFTSGGAQVAGGRQNREVYLASDVDYIRGIHSFRAGTEIFGGHYRSDDSTNYLGTYTFTSLEAFAAGHPATFTRRIGDPLIRYWYVQSGAYFQDDLRISKALTLSPGLRYEGQTHARDYSAFGPRFGFTWAPAKNGRTTLRASIGKFSNWVSANTYEQTLRVDGFRQQEVDIVNPTYPDPGVAGTLPLTNRYLLGEDVRMVRTMRVSAGIDQALSPKLRVSALYSDIRGTNFLRGLNLNPSINGTRSDSRFANVIEAVCDGQWRSHQLVTSVTMNLAAGVGGANQSRINWRRTTLTATHRLGWSSDNAIGAFTPPPTGSLSTEWGPASSDVRRRVSVGVNSQALKNLSANVSLTAITGAPYTITTGSDDNGDSVFNDRPTDVGRNSVRATGQYFWSANLTYALGVGGQLTGGPGANDRGTRGSARARVSFVVSISNLTNRANYAAFSGVMTSRFFLRPTAVANPRKVDLGLNISF